MTNAGLFSQVPPGQPAIGARKAFGLVPPSQEGLGLRSGARWEGMESVWRQDVEPLDDERWAILTSPSGTARYWCAKGIRAGPSQPRWIRVEVRRKMGGHGISLAAGR